jgi:hypothetical protein
MNEMGYSPRFKFLCTNRQYVIHVYEGINRACEHFGKLTKEVQFGTQKPALLDIPENGKTLSSY